MSNKAETARLSFGGTLLYITTFSPCVSPVSKYVNLIILCVLSLHHSALKLFRERARDSMQWNLGDHVL